MLGTKKALADADAVAEKAKQSKKGQSLIESANPAEKPPSLPPRGTTRSKSAYRPIPLDSGDMGLRELREPSNAATRPAQACPASLSAPGVRLEMQPLPKATGICN